MDDDEYYNRLNMQAKVRSLDGDYTAGLGHNSEAAIIARVNSTLDNLVKLGEEHEEALQVLVDNQEEERESILLVLGRQLLSGRKLNEGKREFGKWCSLNFQNLREHVSYDEQVAILWAAEFPEQHQDMLDKHSRVRTARGLYAKWKEENKKTTGDSSAKGEGSGGNSETGKPNGGTNNSGGNTDKPSKPPQGKGDINTENPDNTTVKVDAALVASSLIGVVTNMLMFEKTQGRGVEERELASAIFHEIRSQSVEQLTESEIEDYIESNLKRTLSVIQRSLPILDVVETNVVSIQKTMERF
jgi:hypothetical protein